VRGRWSRTSSMYLLAAFLCSALAGASMHAFLARAAEAANGGGPRVPVVVAAQSILRGTTLRAADVRVLEMPRAYEPPGSIARVSQAAGRVALGAIAMGEAVTETRLARVRAGPVASLTPEGLRAFAVPTSLPAGVVVAGDHVDVLATFGSGQPHTETAATGVEVLMVLGAPAPGGSGGAGGGFDAGATGAPPSTTLMLLVSSQQAEGLAFASAFATLSVSIAPADGGA
jgi:Flp pilus assembly protein CpaB